MAEPQTQDQQRLGEAETDIGVLKSDAQTTAKLLAGIAAAMKELTAAQYPHFPTVVKTFSAGSVAASIFLAGYFYLTDAQIEKKISPVAERLQAEIELLKFKLDRVESAIAWQPSFVNVK